MKARAHFGLAVGLALLAGRAAAADEPDVCAWLSAAEVEGAAGAKVAPGTRSETPMPSAAGSLKGVPRVGCSWVIGSVEEDFKTAGSVYLSAVSLTPEQAGAGISFRKDSAATAKNAGFDVKETALGEATCSVMKPPSSVAGLGTSTGCSIEAKGRVIALDASGQGVKTTAEKIKAALDKAVSRLP